MPPTAPGSCKMDKAQTMQLLRIGTSADAGIALSYARIQDDDDPRFQDTPGSVDAAVAFWLEEKRRHEGLPLAIVPPVHEPLPELLDELALCVSRLQHGNESIGTCIRIMGDLVLTSRHCVTDGKRCLEGLEAFGGRLQFIAAQGIIDLAVFRGPKGPSLDLVGGPLRIGEQVVMLSFPQAFDKDPASQATRPAVDQGVISQVGPSTRLAITTFSTCMPNCSGAAVVKLPCALHGMHVGTTYHEEPLRDSGAGGSSSGGGSSTASSTSTQPIDAVETDPNNMFWVVEAEEEGGSWVGKSPSEASAEEVAATALLSSANVPQKACAGVMVPAAAILQLLLHLDLVATPQFDTRVLHQAVAQARAKKQKVVK